MRAAVAEMTDYQRIRLGSKGYRKLRVADTAQFHAQQRRWLQEKLDEPFNGSTIVVTHMAPSKLSVPEEFSTDPLSAAYASDLDHLAAKADIWVHAILAALADNRLERKVRQMRELGEVFFGLCSTYEFNVL
jgi:hypothetical protein